MAIFLAPSGLRALLIDPLWTSTTAYPGGNFSAGSCVTYAGHLFCVGGDNDSNVWHAPITPVGVDAWQQTSAYGEGGQNIFLSCAAANGYIYCVGGSNLGGFSGDVNSDVWYAPISANGIGQWQQTTLYGFPVVAVTGTKAGVPIWSHSCTINDGYLYCVGGFIRQYQIVATQNGSVSVPFDNPTARVYSAPIENDGSIGFWQQTTSYGQTIAGHSCVTNDGYIYCVGGTSGNGLSDSDTSAVWYAQFLPNGGLTQWNQTTGYGGGAVDGLSCTAAEGRIFCTGGNSQQVWSASLSSAGVGAWTQQTDYPEAIWSPSCVSQKSEVICVGGGQAAAARASSSRRTRPVSRFRTRTAATRSMVSGTAPRRPARCIRSSRR